MGHQLNKKSFTLLEIVLVIVVISVLAGLTLPQFPIVVERVRSSEGVHILTVLLAAQKRYAMENGGVYSSDPADLDVTIPPSPNFSVPAIKNDPTRLATVTRSSYNLYTLRIDENGNITCENSTPPICNRLGY